LRLKSEEGKLGFTQDSTSLATTAYWADREADREQVRKKRKIARFIKNLRFGLVRCLGKNVRKK
jgi:hypothetical protein